MKVQSPDRELASEEFEKIRRAITQSTGLNIVYAEDGNNDNFFCQVRDKNQKVCYTIVRQIDGTLRLSSDSLGDDDVNPLKDIVLCVGDADAIASYLKDKHAIAPEVPLEGIEE